MASPKYRDYMITINKGATCYDDALDIVKELRTRLFAYIIHDKDILIDDKGIEKPKEVHKHIVLELVNPISFDSMRNKFVGAHIQTIKYKKAAYQYLLHESPNSKGEKYQYDLKEIITNNLESVKVAITSEEGIRIFQENMFLHYICEGIITPFRFVQVFGLNAYKQYWKVYYEMIIESKTDIEMQSEMEIIYKEIAEDLPF